MTPTEMRAEIERLQRLSRAKQATVNRLRDEMEQLRILANIAPHRAISALRYNGTLAQALPGMPALRAAIAAQVPEQLG